MNETRGNVKVLLLCFRDEERMRESDLSGFSQACGLPAGQIKVYSVPPGPPPEELLEEVDGVLIGGSKWSVFEDVPNLPATQDFLWAAKSRGVSNNR